MWSTTSPRGCQGSSPPAPVSGWRRDHRVRTIRPGAWRHQVASVQALLDDPATAARTFAHPMIPTCPLPDAIDRFYTTDVLMHTWDLARAGGHDDGLDPAECAALLASMEPLDEMLRQSGQYGPRQPAATDADGTARLMAFIGREPRLAAVALAVPWARSTVGVMVSTSRRSVRRAAIALIAVALVGCGDDSSDSAADETTITTTTTAISRGDYVHRRVRHQRRPRAPPPPPRPAPTTPATRTRRSLRTTPRPGRPATARRHRPPPRATPRRRRPPRPRTAPRRTGTDLRRGRGRFALRDRAGRRDHALTSWSRPTAGPTATPT